MEAESAGWATFLTALCMLSSVHGSDIKFDSSPSSIQPPLTSNMTMRCSLNDNAVATAGTPIIGRRDVNHTDTDVVYVTSIVVMHDGKDIASLSEHVAVQYLGSAGNVQVTGQVSSNSPERGFIELTWQYPLKSDAGQYTCEVAGVSKKGHAVVFSKTLEVMTGALNIADLAASITSLKIEYGKDITLLKQHNTILQQQNTNQAASITSLKIEHEKDITFLKQQINQIKNTNTNQENEISSLQSEVHELRHVETGTIICGNSDTWTGSDGDYKAKTVTTYFSRSYNRSPKVHLGIFQINDTEDDETTFEIRLEWVASDRFAMHCGMARKNSKVYHMSATWISIPV